MEHKNLQIEINIKNIYVKCQLKLSYWITSHLSYEEDQDMTKKV